MSEDGSITIPITSTMNMRGLMHKSRRLRGFTLLEVMLGLGIMTAGILAISAIFPYTLRAQRDAELLTVAAAYAQMKVEEVRRDSGSNGQLILALRALNEPTTPITFPDEPRLAYSYCGQTTLFDNTGIPNDLRAAPNVARVLIRYAPGYRSTQDVIYELRFN